MITLSIIWCSGLITSSAYATVMQSDPIRAHFMKSGTGEKGTRKCLSCSGFLNDFHLKEEDKEYYYITVFVRIK